jgi:hypothetical protein
MNEVAQPIEKKKRFSRKFWVYTVLILLAIMSLVVYFRYYFVYSEGTRVGILYKFSRKGTMFKTYEGEMMLPGYSRSGDNASTKTFYFSVTDEALAKKLMSSQGDELEIHYNQYNNGLTWRGDTYPTQEGQYVVDRLIKVKNRNPNGYGM